MKQLIQSNDTRWNSYFMSICQALNCRKRIKQYITDCEPLTCHDWTVLEKIHSALHPYYEATLCNEGNHNYIGHWFVTIDFLLSKTWDACCEFEELKKQNPRCQEYVWLEMAAKVPGQSVRNIISVQTKVQLIMQRKYSNLVASGAGSIRNGLVTMRRDLG